jgi:hypothetical protein
MDLHFSAGTIDHTRVPHPGAQSFSARQGGLSPSFNQPSRKLSPYRHVKLRRSVVLAH